MMMMLLSIKPPGTSVSKFKTTAKLATAAVLGHNIITTNDESIKDILPNLASLKAMFELVDKDFYGDKKLWYKGLEIMKKVKKKLSLDVLVRRYAGVFKND
eukprot:Pgem_evm1s4866